MSALGLILRRELGAYFRSFTGWAIAAGVLLVQGLLFSAYAMGTGDKLSSKVIQDFFYFSMGMTVTASVLISMRLIAEERHDGTMVLLFTSPASDWSITLGKWASAWVFVLLLLGASVYMPLLVAVNGSVNPGHVFAGYLGLALMAAAYTAIGTFASALTQSQVVAAILGAVLSVITVVFWLLSKVTEPPFEDVFAYMDFYSKHFQYFAEGAIHLRSVVYWLSVTLFFLLGTRQVLGARRWR
jgi:ABC-2 type transport system permease protein